MLTCQKALFPIRGLLKNNQIISYTFLKTELFGLNGSVFKILKFIFINVFSNQNNCDILSFGVSFMDEEIRL